MEWQFPANAILVDWRPNGKGNDLWRYRTSARACRKAGQNLEAALMKKASRKRKTPKRVLRLPDLDYAKRAVSLGLCA